MRATWVIPAETRGWLCPEQPGFRTSRSCEDQILRVTQTIIDGNQAAKPKRTVLTLLDFSKAFDRVWKEDLLLRAMDKGLPLTFAKWLRDFLSNRQARIQINGEQGWPVPLKQGLLQGSVQSPLLFLLYINDLKTVAPNGVEVAMFADYASLSCSHPCNLTAQTAMQEAVTRVAEWSR